MKSRYIDSFSKTQRTPKLAKFLLWLAVGYMLLPFDIIPDFIPVIGHLDDAVIVPVLVIFALKMIPEEVIRECRSRVVANNTGLHGPQP